MNKINKLKEKASALCIVEETMINHFGIKTFLSMYDFESKLFIPTVVASEKNDQRIRPTNKRMV